MPSVNPGPSNSSTVNTQPLVGSFDNSGNLLNAYGPNNVPLKMPVYVTNASGNVIGSVDQNGNLYQVIKSGDGDQQTIATDLSPLRTGTWALTPSGALYTLLGEFAMWYWTHNVQIDANGNFLGRDEAGICQLWVFTESGLMRTYNAGNAAAGVVPAWTSTTVMNLNNGSMILGSTITVSSLILGKVITPAGTTGAQTINTSTGSVNFAAGATSLVVTNNTVTTNSVINATVATNDATMKSVQVVATAGSFTIYSNAAATAETRVNFRITN